MAHPYQAHRENKVMHDRVAKITKGYARGGQVLKTDDEPSGLSKTGKLTGKTAATGLLKSMGTSAKPRLDRPAFARGGRANGKTNINVIVAPQGGGQAQPPMPMVPPGPGPAAMPAPTPKPAMPPPGAMPGGPGGAPTGMPVRASGGRISGMGGAKAEGMRNGTKVSHTPGKNDLGMISTKPPITRKKGGRVYPDMEFGAGGGKGRLEKERKYG